jgi:PKD repeat protein
MLSKSSAVSRIWGGKKSSITLIDIEPTFGEYTIEIPAPPLLIANFIGEPLSGNFPLTVNFTDLSTGGPTTWAWDFTNNGSTDSTSQNPSYTYSTPGTYSVKLTVTNQLETNSRTRTNYINVTTPPSTPVSFATPISLPTSNLCVSEPGLTNVLNNVAWYSITLTSTTSVTFDTSGSTPGTDTMIGVYNSDGNLLGADDDSGPGYLSSLTLNNLLAGTYYIAVGYYYVQFGFNNWNAVGDSPVTDDCIIKLSATQ